MRLLDGRTVRLVSRGEDYGDNFKRVRVLDDDGSIYNIVLVDADATKILLCEDGRNYIFSDDVDMSQEADIDYPIYVLKDVDGMMQPQVIAWLQQYCGLSFSPYNMPIAVDGSLRSPVVVEADCCVAGEGGHSFKCIEAQDGSVFALMFDNIPDVFVGDMDGIKTYCVPCTGVDTYMYDDFSVEGREYTAVSSTDNHDRARAWNTWLWYFAGAPLINPLPSFL